MADENENPKSIQLHYVKTNNYRTMHVSGVYGGAAPKVGAKDGVVFMSLFTERPPIPKMVECPLEGEQIRGDKELRRESKDGVIREVEIGCIMNLSTAKALASWLQHKINVIEGKAT